MKSTAKLNVFRGWMKCLDIVSSKIATTDESYRSDIKDTVKGLIEAYIQEPSEIRNKIAHGQWKVSLNSRNTAVNEDFTEKVANLNVVDLTKYKASFVSLCTIIKDLIESPHNAHWKFYEPNVTSYREEQARMSTWTLEDKIRKLKPKKDHYRKNIMNAT